MGMIKKTFSIESNTSWTAVIKDYTKSDDDSFIDSGDSEYEISNESESWIFFDDGSKEISGVGDDKVVLNIAENESYYERTALVTVTSDDGTSKTVTIKQKGKSTLNNGLPSSVNVDEHDLYYRTSNHHSIFTSGQALTNARLISDTYYYKEDEDGNVIVNYGVMHHQDGYNTLKPVSELNDSTGLVTVSGHFDPEIIEGIVVNSSVINFSDGQFNGCTNLESFDMPENVTIVPEACFYDCAKLTSIALGDKVTIIDKSAFQKSGLTEIVIPDSVEQIGVDAFAGCSDLKKITFKGIGGVSLISRSSHNSSSPWSGYTPGDSTSYYQRAGTITAIKSIFGNIDYFPHGSECEVHYPAGFRDSYADIIDFLHDECGWNEVEDNLGDKCKLVILGGSNINFLCGPEVENSRGTDSFGQGRLKVYGGGGNRKSESVIYKRRLKYVTNANIEYNNDERTSIRCTKDGHDDEIYTIVCPSWLHGEWDIENEQLILEPKCYIDNSGVGYPYYTYNIEQRTSDSIQYSVVGVREDEIDDIRFNGVSYPDVYPTYVGAGSMKKSIDKYGVINLTLKMKSNEMDPVNAYPYSNSITYTIGHSSNGDEMDVLDVSSAGAKAASSWKTGYINFYTTYPYTVYIWRGTVNSTNPNEGKIVDKISVTQMSNKNFNSISNTGKFNITEELSSTYTRWANHLANKNAGVVVERFTTDPSKVSSTVKLLPDNFPLVDSERYAELHEDDPGRTVDSFGGESAGDYLNRWRGKDRFTRILTKNPKKPKYVDGDLIDVDGELYICMTSGCVIRGDIGVYEDGTLPDPLEGLDDSYSRQCFKKYSDELGETVGPSTEYGCGCTVYEQDPKFYITSDCYVKGDPIHASNGQKKRGKDSEHISWTTAAAYEFTKISPENSFVVNKGEVGTYNGRDFIKDNRGFETYNASIYKNRTYTEGWGYHGDWYDVVIQNLGSGSYLIKVFVDKFEQSGSGDNKILGRYFSIGVGTTKYNPVENSDRIMSWKPGMVSGEMVQHYIKGYPIGTPLMRGWTFINEYRFEQY